MKKIDTVIFDWAGTTIDYGCFAPLAAFMNAFKQKGIDITEEEARGPMGMKKIDHVRALLSLPRIAEAWSDRYGDVAGERDVEELYNGFEVEIFSVLSNYCSLIPGVRETVNTLRSAGIKIGSTTGYTREMMDIVVPESEKNGYKPDSIITATEVPAGRPAPFMIWRNAINLAASDLHRICKVGDTESDIREGVNAGVWSVGVVLGSSEWGLTEEESGALSSDERTRRMQRIRYTFLIAGAHFVIDDIGELPGLLDVIDRRLADGRRPS